MLTRISEATKDLPFDFNSRSFASLRMTQESDYQEARLSIHELVMAMYFRMRDEALATLHESYT